MTDDEKIAAYIREHGVTLCPPAYAEGCECRFPVGNVIVVDFGTRWVTRERAEPW